MKLAAVLRAAAGAAALAFLLGQAPARADTPQLNIAGGWKPAVLSGLSSTPVTVKSGPGQLAVVMCYNPNTTQAYVQLLDGGALGSPVFDVPIAASQTGGFSLALAGVQFFTSIKLAATTTATGTTAPSTALDCSVVYY